MSSKTPSAVLTDSTTNSSGKKRIYKKSKTITSKSKSKGSVVKSFISKAKTKESTGTGTAEPKSRSKSEVKTHYGWGWVNDNVPSLRKTKIIRDQEKEEERQEQIGKLLEARDSEKKFLPQSTRRKNARPLSIQQIRDKIHHQDQLHSDPLITLTHTFDGYQKKPVSTVDSDSDSNSSSSSWDLIQEAFFGDKGEGKEVVANKFGESSRGGGPDKDLSNDEELVLPSTSRQTAISISGEHNNYAILSTRPEPGPEPAKASKKIKGDNLYHFGQVKITTKSKNKGRKRITKFVPTNEFFKGTVFEKMFA